MMPTGSAAQTTYLRLNTGPAGVGKYIGGVALIDGNFSWLRNPNTSSSSGSFTAAADVTLNENIWYTVSLQITQGLTNSDFSYDMTLVETIAGTPIFTHSTSMAPNAISEDPLRLTISLIEGSTDLQIRNMNLTAVPEPGTTVAVMACAMLLLLGVTKGRRTFRRGQ